jgi:hypothetical protein
MAANFIILGTIMSFRQIHASERPVIQDLSIINCHFGGSRGRRTMTNGH